MLCKLKVVLSVLIIYCFTYTAKAKRGNDSLFVAHKHALKMRVLFPIIDLVAINTSSDKIIGFMYEYIIKPKQTFFISAEYKHQIKSLDLTTDNSYIDSYSDGFILHPEYRVYLNKKRIYPRGYHIGIATSIGYAEGRSTIGKLPMGTYAGTGPFYPSYTQSDFSVLILGLGVNMGVQYFLGKRKRLIMDNSIAIYGNKNTAFTESLYISDNDRMYPTNKIVPAVELVWTLGYTFGKLKP